MSRIVRRLLIEAGGFLGQGPDEKDLSRPAFRTKQESGLRLEFNVTPAIQASFR
jgi:hypothetical protein